MEKEFSPEKKENKEPLKIGDRVRLTTWIPPSYANPRIPPGTLGRIVGTDTVKDWRIQFEIPKISEQLVLTVLSEHIEKIPDEESKEEKEKEEKEKGVFRGN